VYSYNQSSASERPVTQLACYVLVGLAITFGALAFWSKGVVPAVLLTAAFGSLSFLLSGAVIRFSEAWAKNAKVTAFLAVAMGLVCLLFEANMTHLGLEHLNEQYAIAPAWALWPASFGLSLFNVFSVYAFAREIPEPKRQTTAPAARRSEGQADNIVMFGSDPQERKTLQAVVDKMKAGGAL
jgi:hypothetical protein